MACPFDTDGDGDCSFCTKPNWACNGVGPIPTRSRPNPDKDPDGPDTTPQRP